MEDVPPAEIVAEPAGPHWLCVGCGYDLRGSDPQGNCPECGRLVADSEPKETVYRPIKETDRAWALGMVSGLRFGGICMALQTGYLLLGVLVGVGALMAGLFSQTYSTQFQSSTLTQREQFIGLVAGLTLLAGRAVVSGVGAWGFWNVSRPEPGREKPATWEGWRLCTAGAAWVAFVLCLLEVVACVLLPFTVLLFDDDSVGFGMMAAMFVWPIEMAVFAVGCYGCAHAGVEMAGRMGGQRWMDPAKWARKVYQVYAIGLIAHMVLTYSCCCNCLTIVTWPVIICAGAVAAVVMCGCYLSLARAVEESIQPQEPGVLSNGRP